jgi:hypothetical protein
MPLEEAVDGSESEAITLLKQRLSKFETEQGRLSGLNYQPRPTDVAISTTPKAGTTWMQQICHQLRSNGDMNFDEISRVVPWIELAFDQGQDLEAPQWNNNAEACNTGQVPVPRLFKTHAWADHCPPFSKTIVVLRRPEDVVVSFYRFFSGWFFEPGTISLDAFSDEFWLARGIPSSKMQNASYFHHLISWYKRRNEQGILIVFFEDLKENLATQVERIAKFISTEQHNFNRPELVQKAVAHSSFAFMKAHESHFDERLSKLARNEACGLPLMAGMASSKLNDGKVGTGQTVLSEHLKAKIQQKWKEVVEPVTGCTTYEELRQQLKDN